MGLKVSCKNLKKTFGEGTNRVEALRGIDLEVREGEFIMLMGPSGSGKTTLISILSGILTQTEGECKLGDTRIDQLSPEERIRFRGERIGFVFQIFNLIPMLTCAENVAVPLLIQGQDQQFAENKAKKLLESVGIGDKANTTPDQLSGGQQQRVAIARGLIHDPDLIVCDEPTSFLDHETGIRVMELLRTLVKEQKKTLLLVTHDSRITQYADRIVHIEDGLLKDC